MPLHFTEDNDQILHTVLNTLYILVPAFLLTYTGVSPGRIQTHHSSLSSPGGLGPYTLLSSHEQPSPGNAYTFVLSSTYNLQRMLS